MASEQANRKFNGVTGGDEDSDLIASRFATTRWDLVLASAQTLVPGADAAMTDLCRTYWRPLYAYVRRRGYSASDAEDLVQEFFLRFLEQRAVKKADPLRGRFRTFLLHSIQNFLANEWDRSHAVKRGGKIQFIALEDLTVEERNIPSVRDSSSAEATFDLRWARAIIESVFEQMRVEAAARGREELFESLKGLLTAADSSSYEIAAQRLQMPLSALKTALHRMRGHFRVLVRREVARTVSSPNEIDDELRYLRTLLGAQIIEPTGS